jgi:retron-type reverse transcriptase
VFKSGTKDNFDNYRIDQSVSYVPTISKILEKCVHAQIMDHVEKLNMLTTYQFGFRKQHSTELASVIFLDDIRKAMDNGIVTGAIYVDLNKAFDTISHPATINKLSDYGITGITIPQQWIASYLFGRYQRVSYHQTLSSPEPIYFGVPQGSILGPLLFLLHFNEAASVLSNRKIVKFADDTV